MCRLLKCFFYCKNDVFKVKAGYDEKRWFRMSSFQNLPYSQKPYQPHLGQLLTNFCFVFLPELVMSFQTINVFAKVQLCNVFASEFGNMSENGHIFEIKMQKR